jgi:hypothetical protein
MKSINQLTLALLLRLRELSVSPTANDGGPGLTLMITLSGSRGSR